MDKQALARERSKKYYAAHKEDIKKKRNVILGGSLDLRAKLTELDLKPNSKKAYLASLKRLEKLFPDMTVKTAKPMIEAIDKSDYSIATKKIMVQTLLVMITKFELKVPVKSIEDFRHYLNVLKIKSEDETKQKMDESVPTWSDYLAKLKAEYGTSSKEFLLASLYKELTVRDDFQLQIVKTLPKELEGNYIVVKPTYCTIVISTYNTSDAYGVIQHRLPKALSGMIRSYIASHGDMQYLFGSAKLSPFIAQINKKIGFNTGVNLLRHMSVSEVLNDPKVTPEERATLAETMKHSIATQAKYRRETA